MARTRHPPVSHIGTLLLIALSACASKEIRVTDHQVFGEWPPPEGVIALRGHEGRIEGTHIHCFVGTMIYTDWKPLGDRRRYVGTKGSYEDYTHAVFVKHRVGPDVDCATSFHRKVGSPDRGATTWEVRVGDEAVVVRYLVTREPPLDTVDIGGKGYDLGMGRLVLVDLTADPPEVQQRSDEGIFIASLIFGSPLGSSDGGPEARSGNPGPAALRTMIEEAGKRDPDVEDWLDL
jgi:hypothetical protein